MTKTNFLKEKKSSIDKEILTETLWMISSDIFRQDLSFGDFNLQCIFESLLLLLDGFDMVCQ